MIKAESLQAANVLQLVTGLQSRLANGLTRCVGGDGASSLFHPVKWLRSGGRNGGGTRLVALNHPFFNAASINVSQVHYDHEPDKALKSASALSSIIHPSNPHCPSIHIHISWTEIRSGKSYWRLMADLNPSVIHDETKSIFETALQAVIPGHYDEGKSQGEKYFFIPALGRHRGVAHFYLEEFSSDVFADDAALAQSFGEAVCDAYCAIIENCSRQYQQITNEDRDIQLSYHTMYFFQVLTLDRGTTSGLLIHKDNDIGILGSLPAYIDRELLASWQANLEEVQKQLLQGILEVIPVKSPCPITDSTKSALADTLRQFYKENPAGLEYLARGNTVPSTIKNHT